VWHAHLVWAFAVHSADASIGHVYQCAQSAHMNFNQRHGQHGPNETTIYALFPYALPESPRILSAKLVN